VETESAEKESLSFVKLCSAQGGPGCSFSQCRGRFLGNSFSLHLSVCFNSFFKLRLFNFRFNRAFKSNAELSLNKCLKFFSSCLISDAGNERDENIPCHSVFLLSATAGMQNYLDSYTTLNAMGI